MNRRAMKIKEALCKNSYRDDAAAQNRPHQQSALLDVINHAGFCNALSQLWQARIARGACTYRGRFSRALGEGDGRVAAGLVRPTNLPDTSKTE